MVLLTCNKILGLGCKFLHRSVSTVSRPPYSTLFFGSDKFSLIHLAALKENSANGKTKDAVLKNVHVVSTSDHSPVARYAKKNGLELLPWKAVKQATSLEYDLGIVVSFGYLIPKRVIELFPCGMLNVHPSSLPKYRGATPIQHTILNRESKTSVCVMKLLPHKFDEGAVYKQEEVSIGADEGFDDLRDRLADTGSKLLLETLQDFPSIKPMEQEGEPSFAPKLSYVNSFINWHDQTRQSIYQQHLALGSTYALTTKWKEILIRFNDMVPPALLQDADLPDAEPGTVRELRPSRTLVVRCKDGWVGFNTVLYNKKRLTSQDFYNAYVKKEKESVLFISMDNELNILSSY